MDELRVLHVLNYSLPYISGYCSRSHYILKAQRALGMEVAAVTSPRQEGIVSSSSEVEEIDGIPYHRSGFSSGRGPQAPLIREWWRMKKLQERLTEVAEELRPAVIHAHSPSLCGLPALKCTSRLGLPLVYEMRALWEEAAVDQGAMGTGSWKYRASRYLENKVLRRSQRVVVLCRGLAAELVARGIEASRISVVPNGVDWEHFSPRLKNAELASSLGVEGGVTVGFIGTFFRFEGLDDLVRAWASAGDGKAKLLLVGYGELMDELRKLREASPQRESIILAGKVPHEKILDYYALMDIIVYPRKKVRLTDLVTPLKPLEAMAMGKPVVASAVGGLQEIIANGRTGLLFRPGDISDLGQKIRILAGNRTLREELGANARRWVQERRGWRTIVREYDRIYREISRPARGEGRGTGEEIT